MRELSSRLHAIALATVAVAGCSLVDDGPGTPPLNPKFAIFAYWGSVDPENESINVGTPSSGPLRAPLWLRPETVVANSYRLHNAQIQRGLFSLQLSAALTVETFAAAPAEWVDTIVDVCQIGSSDTLAIVVYDAGETEVRRVVVEGDLVTTNAAFIGPEWQPLAVAAPPGRPGIVFYGRSPERGIHGFYWHHAHGDSLLYSVDLSASDARGFTLDRSGRYLFYAANAGALSFLRIDLLGSSPRVTLAHREGTNGEIMCNPADDRVLLTYHFGGDAQRPPGSHIELGEAHGERLVPLDVRTMRTSVRMFHHEHPSWSPDGRHFVITAWSTTGEGDRSSESLWLYRDVP